jgi:hypothetical protein
MKPSTVNSLNAVANIGVVITFLNEWQSPTLYLGQAWH